MKEVNRTVLQQLSRLKAPNCPPLPALGDFLERKGPPADRQALESHLRSCPSCLNRLIDIQELAFLEKKGEEPSRQLVEEVKNLVPPAQGRQEAGSSLVKRGTALLSAIGKTLWEWSSPRFLGEVVAATAAAVFLVLIGTNAVQQKSSNSPIERETITAALDLSTPTRKLLTSLTQVSPSSASWWQQIATTLETIPATPDMEKPRGATNIEVYKKAVAATVLIETDDGLGSGSIISARGEVLTNWHVIAGARRITVYFKPEEGVQARKDLAFTATPIKVDQVADLALLQIQAPPADLHPLEFGNLKELEVGQDVHAIGHPKGQTWTYTTGTISQIRPDYQWRDEKLLHQGTVIQTQTPINPGNSGGPLLNDQAELIGVNSFIATEAEGLNYAVAVDTIKAFLQKAASPPASPLPPPSLVSSPSPAPRPAPLPSPGAPAYRTEPFGQQIVGTYVTARVPPPDVWLVYRDPARQHPAYAAKGSKTATQIDTIVVGADPQWQVLVYYLDTNCDGVIDLVGYDLEGNGKLERYGPPPQPQRLAQLARELAEALTDGTIPYSQIHMCPG